MLVHGEQRENGVVLRAVADHPSHFTEVLDRIDVLNFNLTTSWHYLTCETLEHRRFARSVDSEQGEALADIETK